MNADPLVASKDGQRLLKTLHIMNADGSVSADMRRKLKQVRHLVELFSPVLSEIARRRGAVRVLDANCGNSYLTFLLRNHVASELGVPVFVHGVDKNPERVAACRERAEKLGLKDMTFVAGGIENAEIPDGIDILVSLHGCDVASDHALKRGVALSIPHLHVAPCCQAELRPLIRPDGRFSAFTDDGIVAADFAATLTDVIRALWLRTCGYRAEIVEFVPLEHSLKNRLIRAKFTKRKDERARRDLDDLLAALSAPPAITR